MPVEVKVQTRAIHNVRVVDTEDMLEGTVPGCRVVQKDVVGIKPVVEEVEEDTHRAMPEIMVDLGAAVLTLRATRQRTCRSHSTPPTSNHRAAITWISLPLGLWVSNPATLTASGGPGRRALAIRPGWCARTSAASATSQHIQDCLAP